MTTILNSADLEHFHQWRKFWWTTLLYNFNLGIYSLSRKTTETGPKTQFYFLKKVIYILQGVSERYSLRTTQETSFLRSEGEKKSHCFNWLPCTELSLLIMADLRTTGPNIKNPTYSWRYQRANKVDQDEASPAFRANLSLRRGGWESEQSFDRLQQESANYGPWAKSVLVPDFVNKALLKCLMLINSRTVYGSFAE